MNSSKKTFVLFSDASFPIRIGVGRCVSSYVAASRETLRLDGKSLVFLSIRKTISKKKRLLFSFSWKRSTKKSFPKAFSFGTIKSQRWWRIRSWAAAVFCSVTKRNEFSRLEEKVFRFLFSFEKASSSFSETRTEIRSPKKIKRSVVF